MNKKEYWTIRLFWHDLLFCRDKGINPDCLNSVIRRIGEYVEEQRRLLVEKRKEKH